MAMSPRQTTPRRWQSLALGATVSLAAAPLLAADLHRPAPITLSMPGATLWLAQSQGGEAGEAGITSVAPADPAYLAELAIIEGHMLAARNLYALGQADTAVTLSRHPEEEGTLATLNTAIAAHGAQDFSSLISAFTAQMAKGATQDDVDATLARIHVKAAAAAAGLQDQPRIRFDAIVLVLKAAAAEYANSITDGKVTDVMAFHESYAFIQLARAAMADLGSVPLAAKAAPRALEALMGAEDAFGDMTKPPEPRDPAILLSVSARVELIASQVR